MQFSIFLSPARNNCFLLCATGPSLGDSLYSSFASRPLQMSVYLYVCERMYLWYVGLATLSKPCFQLKL